MANPPQPPQVQRAIVKQILSGDLIVLRGQPKGGPPPERTLALSNIVAPKLARRPNPNSEGSETKDEPYAWEAREYLRKRLVGRAVHFVVDVKVPSGREYGSLYLVEEGGSIENGENISETLIKEGLVGVRREAKSGVEKLIELEDAAKSAGKGKWGPPEQLQAHVRDIHWSVENPMTLVEKYDKKPIQAVIEHVRDGSTVRAFLLPDMYHVTLMISGVKSPMFKMGDEGQQSAADPFAEEAKYFTESRLLQRDVQIVLETVSNANYVGSIIHPNGDIAELLLREGFAKCADWTIRSVVGGPAKLRAAEAAAREKKLKMWRDFVSKAITIPESDRQFSAKVVEVVGADALMVKKGDGPAQKIFLASVRPPKLPEDKQAETKKRQFRPLYDVPYMYEAREFLRTKLIGKKIDVTLDYIQPAAQQYPEKRCCTVMIAGLNIAEALVSKGLATVVKYRQDDDQRSSRYDELLAAESKAQKSLKGLHSKKEFTAQRVIELSGDATKAKTSLSSLKRGGRVDAVVEFVASGARFRLYLKKDQSLVTFLLGGINCPRGSRPLPGGAGMTEAEPFGEEAMQFAKDLCMQREVQVEFDTVDRAGNFVGWLFVEEKNLSQMLVEEGLATVHPIAEKSSYYDRLRSAESAAKKKKLRLWKDYDENQEKEEVEEVVNEKETVERAVNYRKVVLTEVTDEFMIFVQSVDKGTELEGLMVQIRQEFASNPPLGGSYVPKRGDICAAKFSYDGAWYRAKVEKILPEKRAQVLYIDYGNREEVASTALAALPSSYQSPAAYAREYGVAFAALPKDLDLRKDAIAELLAVANEQELCMNVEYKVTNTEFVTLYLADSKKDVIKLLLENGLLMAQPRRDARFKQISNEYKEAENLARRKHLNIWEYGDITEDDAVEFGFSQPRP